MDAVHELYVKAGARNFILIDVPPVHVSPQGAFFFHHYALRRRILIFMAAEASGVAGDVEERVETWNELLRTQAEEFAASSSQATVFLFSSFALLTEPFEDPASFDVDGVGEDGWMWADDLHLVEEVHEVMARNLFKSLVPDVLEG